MICRERLRRRVWLGAVLAVLVGCAARIDRFSAVPRHICPGQEVTLSWSVVGSPTMTAVPPVEGFTAGRVAREGEARIAPRSTTRVELRTTRRLGNPTTSIQEIEVTGEGGKVEPLTVSLADASAGCANRRVWATVQVRRFAEDVTIATVQEHPGDARTYLVHHAGMQAAVAPGMVAREFAGMPIRGDWLLESPLRPGEACGTPTLPRSLVVDVVTQCVVGGGQ